MDDALYRRMLPIFIDEVVQRLDEMDRAIHTLTESPGDEAALATLSRAAHTIKGNAAALGMKQMVAEAQRIEWWAMDAPPSLTRVARATLQDARTELRRLLDAASSDIVRPEGP